MPKKAASHIHSSAPGPPAAIAVATPTMLPVPMVADSAVHSAPKLDTSPSPSSFWNMYLKARGSLRTGRNTSRTVRYMPTPRMSTMRGMPHTKSSTACTISSKVIAQNLPKRKPPFAAACGKKTAPSFCLRDSRIPAGYTFGAEIPFLVSPE